MKKRINRKALKQWLVDIPVPEGFTKRLVEGKIKYGREAHDEHEGKVHQGFVELVSKDIHLVFNYDFKSEWSFIDGHTYYFNKNYWYCFDERGIEDSFYVNIEPENTPQQVVDEQIKRIKYSIERSAGFVSIPGFGWSIHKDNIERAKEEIMSGGRLFTPHGMGQANRLTHKQRSRYARKANDETAKFFGFKELWIEDVDWD
jgi:hypothetical protein